MNPSSIILNAARLVLRYIRRGTELPAVMVLGIVILISWFLLTASANESSRHLAGFFTRYFINIPLRTSVDPDNLSLSISQMMVLFTTWGALYFIFAELISFAIRRMIRKSPAHPRLWLMVIIIASYSSLIALYLLHRQAGAPVQGVVSVSAFLVLIAAASLGVSHLLATWEGKLRPQPSSQPPARSENVS